MNLQNSSRQTTGFTLLEVLVAMTIIGIALLTLAATGSKQIQQLNQLQQQTLAHWVAQNVITEFRLSTAQAPGQTGGIEVMGQQNWYWQLNAEPASDPLILRLDVAIYSDAQRQNLSATETGFSLQGSSK